MRMTMSLAIAAMIALFAIGTYATATTTPYQQSGFSGGRINVLELMSSSKNLPAQLYEAF
jgi:hypothetical protein